MRTRTEPEADGRPHLRPPTSAPPSGRPEVDAFQRRLAAFAGHDTLDRLAGITAPTLVLAGELDLATPPRLGRVVAERIPGAGFEVLPGEAHQPFQEVPDVFNARVDAFRREVGARGELPQTVRIT